jgi:hypothetical protein
MLAGAARLFWVPTSHQTLFAPLATAIQQAETQASNPQHFFHFFSLSSDTLNPVFKICVLLAVPKPLSLVQ